MKKTNLLLLFLNLELFYVGYIIHSNYDFKWKIYILLALLFLINFFIYRKIKSKLPEIILTLSSVLFTLFCFEIFLYILFGNSYYGEHSREGRVIASLKKGTIFDSRSSTFVIREMRKTNSEVYQGIGSSYFWGYHKRKFELDSRRYIPLGNPSNVTIVHCNENGYYQIYKTDEIGFHNPANTLKKAKIIFLGDSFVQGSCVKSNENFTSAFKEEEAVLNLGSGGNGPVSNLATMREISPYVNHLEKVIYFHYEGNDLSDLSDELKDEIMAQYVDNPNFTQNFILNKSKIDPLLKDFSNQEYNEFVSNTSNESIFYINRVNYFLKKSFKSSLKMETLVIPEDKEVIQKFEKIILQIKKESEKRQSKLYFVYLPEYARYAVSYENKQYELVKKMVEDNNIIFLDVVELFKQEADPLSLFPFGLNGHYNEKGYSLVSKYLHEKITSVK